MRNFAEEQRGKTRPAAERTFVLPSDPADETFVLKASIKPDVLARWDAVGEGAQGSVVFEAIDYIIEGSLPKSDHERYRAVRANDGENPANLGTLMAVVQWIVETETSFPTQGASPSGDGSTSLSNGASSTVAAPLPVSTPQPSLSAVSSEPDTRS